MAVNLATAYVQLIPSARGFQAAVEKEIGPQLGDASERAATPAANRFGSKFTSAMKGHGRAAALGFAAALTGAAVIGKAAVDAASDLEESQNKVNVVFREGADDINAWARNASTKIGLSRQAALDAAGGFGNLFIQLGIGADQAAEMSTGMVNLSADFASFHNADISEVIDAQAAAFRGEYDALQRFVPTINAAAVEQRAMEMGLAATTKELDAQDKALATQALMMEGAGDAAGDFARTSDGLANRQRIASAQFKDMQATLGRVLIPAMSVAVDVVSKLVAGFGSFVNFMRENKPVLIGTLTGVGAGLVALTVASAPAIAAGFGVAAAWIAAAAPFIAIGAAVAAAVAGLVYAYQNFDWFRTAVDAVVDALIAAGEWLVEAWKVSFDAVSSVVSTAIDVVKGIIEVGVEAFRKAWGPIELLFKIWKTVYVDPVVFAAKTLFDVVVGIIKTGVATFKTAWNAVEAIYTFFRDNVQTPIANAAGALKDAVVGAIRGAVDTAKTVWNGFTAIVTFFDTYVAGPIKRTVDTLKTAIGNAFELAVSAVKTAWDKLAGIVKTPVNLVIGFYNEGIRWVWNNVISKIPGIGNLDAVAKLNKGGWVPGSGDGDTVPAMLTPGEFVIPKRSAKAWGPGVLEMLQRGPVGSVDPGIFGYAQGGYVRSADEALEWARKQEGKPYQFPMVGPDTYDCSGFTSALINYILGLPPHRRRHSSGSIGSDSAVQRGAGDNPLGLLLGARPPYTTNAQGATIGHIAATLAGVNMEATPPRVRLGQSARGAGHGMFTEQYHLPGYGGLSDSDRSIVSMIKSLVGMKAPEGGSPWESIFPKLVNQLPGKVFDFLMSKLPSLIVDAVKDAVKGVVGAFVPGGDNVFDDIRRRAIAGEYANGGIVRQTGPILVGERGPELAWGSRGMYIESNEDMQRRGSGLPPVTINHHGETVTPETVARGIRLARVS